MSDDSISRQAVVDLVEELETQRLKGDIGLLYAPMIKGVRALPSAQPEWIPVTERLPEYGTAVITINKGDEYEINHVIDEEDGEWFFNGAVAWMPLPEPYKGEKE